jgi:hypothetical protein
MELFENRTEPSSISVLTPPGWELRDVTTS